MKEKRVGTLTMGISLIACGITIILSTFKVFKIAEAARWSPVVLVVLGVEILAYSFSSADKKYDFFSFFICFMLIAFGLCASQICRFF